MTEAEERAYVTRVAMWLLVVGGYRIEEQFVKGEQIITGGPAPAFPEYVIRVDLDGPYADLTWDTMSWSITVCQDADADADPELSQTLTDQADAHPDELLRLARPVLDEAVRRWGTPRWTLTERGLRATGQPAEVVKVEPTDEQRAFITNLLHRKQRMIDALMTEARTVEDLNGDGVLSFAEIKAIAQDPALHILSEDKEIRA
jgi:hypothetical protein